MNDNEIDSQLRGDVLATDPEARERARLRLRTVMAQEHASRARRRHLQRGLVGVSAVAAVLVLLQVVLPPGPVGPGKSAAAELRQLGQLSEAQTTVEAGPSDLVYRKYEEARLISGGSSSLEYRVFERVAVESWIAHDGSGRRDTTYLQVDFVSPLDRENWERTDQNPLHVVGDTFSEQFKPGDAPVYPVQKLPSDADQLLQVIQRGDVIVPPEGDDGLLPTIGALLLQQDLPSDVREALFVVASEIPGVAVESGASDPLGRPAVAVSAASTSGGTRLFFDPADARFLGHSVTVPGDDTHPSFTEWRAYWDSGVVPEAGDRP